MMAERLGFLLVCDLTKSHRKAHFRRDSNGKLVYAHEHEIKAGAGHDVVIAPGDRMRVNNPRSRHHEKHVEVSSYSTTWSCVRAKVDGKSADFQPHHLEPVDAPAAAPVVVRRPVREKPAEVHEPVVEKAPEPVTAKPVGFDFNKVVGEFLKGHRWFKVNQWAPSDRPGWTRYYFENKYGSAAFIQVRDSDGQPMLIGRKGGDSPHMDVVELFREARLQYLSTIGEKLTIPMAFADAGIELKIYADGSATLTGNTYAYREKIAKYGGEWDNVFKRYVLRSGTDLFGLVHDLPPYYNGRDLNVEGPVEGKTLIDSAGSGAGDSRPDPNGHDDGSGRVGAPDRRGDSPSGGEGGRGLSGTDAEGGTRRIVRGLESLSVKELIKSIHEKGITPPDPTHSFDPKAAEGIEFYDHQIEGIEQICSAFKRGQSGFLLGDGTGTGKTYTGAGVIANMKFKNTLVVAPSDGIRKEWEKVLGEAGIECTKADGVNTDFSRSEGVLLATYATFSQNPSLYSTPRDLIVFDEAHQMKNLANEGSKKVAKTGYDAVRMQMRHKKNVLYSTATAYERPDQAKIYEALGLWVPGQFDSWVKDRGIDIRWREVPKRGGGTAKIKEYVIGDDDKVQKSMLVDHIQMVRGGKYLAREPKPEGVFLRNNFRKIALTPEQRHTYNSVRVMYARLAGRAVPRKRGMIMAQRLLWSRRFLESVKLDDVIDRAKTRIAEGKKVSIMLGYKSESNITEQLAKLLGIVKDVRGVETTEFKEFSEKMRAMGVHLDSTLARLKTAFPDAVEYHGGISAGRRKDNKEAFNTGGAKLIIATQQAADTGLSLHDKVGDAPRCQINVTVPWTGMSMKQLAGRSYRLGSKSDVDMEWVFCDTDDEKRRAEMVATRMKLLGVSTSGIDVEESDELYKHLVKFMTGGLEEGDTIVDGAMMLAKSLLHVLRLPLRPFFASSCYSNQLSMWG